MPNQSQCDSCIYCRMPCGGGNYCVAAGSYFYIIGEKFNCNRFCPIDDVKKKVKEEILVQSKKDILSAQEILAQSKQTLCEAENLLSKMCGEMYRQDMENIEQRLNEIQAEADNLCLM